MTEPLHISNLKINKEQYVEFLKDVESIKDVHSSEKFPLEIHIAVLGALAECKKKGIGLDI